MEQEGWHGEGARVYKAGDKFPDFPEPDYELPIPKGGALEPSFIDDVIEIMVTGGVVLIKHGGKWVVKKLTKEVLEEVAEEAAEKGAKIVIREGLGSTGRTVANNLVEQMAMESIVKNPTLGKVVMEGMKDARWVGWSKMQYTVTSENGVKAVIHYVGKFENGVLKAVADFKFK